MQNAIAGDELVPLDDRDESFYLVVSDLVSLIDRVQTSIKLLETARATQPRQATGTRSFPTSLCWTTSRRSTPRPVLRSTPAMRA
jgi:hypothetical protein